MFFRRNEGEFRETDRVTPSNLSNRVKTGFVLQHQTLDFLKLLKVVQTLRQYQFKMLKKKLLFFQVKHSLKGLQQQVLWQVVQ